VCAGLGQKKSAAEATLFKKESRRLTLVHWFVRYSQFLTTFTTTCRQNATTVFSCHTAAEAMLVSSFSYRWLKRSFHVESLFVMFLGLQRYRFFYNFKLFRQNSLKKEALA
jgi:hypothetical protein